MRVTFLLESLQLAGAERVVAELALAGRGEGVEASVVTLRETDALNGSQYGDVPTLALFHAGEFTWPRSAPAAAGRLRSALSHLRPDAMAIHSPRAAVVAALAGIQAPTLWVLHGHDTCWDGATLRRRISRGLQRWTRRRLGGNLAAVSASLAERAAEGLGISSERIAVIPNGVDTQRFRFQENTSASELVVCVLGRLIPAKGPRQALDAFGLVRAEFPAARLWFVGDGPMRAELIAEVAKRRWSEAVTFWGMLHQPEELLRKATALWIPSESEGLPVACIEAMSSGVPVVGFDVRGVRDLLQNGCGVLVKPQDSRALAEQTALLVRNPDRYSRIARAARVEVQKQYSLERMCTGHYDLMRSLCAEKETQSRRIQPGAEEIHAGGRRN